jgi:serine/threonine-protein kinase
MADPIGEKTMTRDERWLDAILESVSDGQSVDWGNAESGAIRDDDRAMIRAIRVIAQIGVLQRSGMSEAPARATLAAGRYGHLQILERLGGGSYGDVYLARDERLHRDVALKILGEEEAGGASWLAEARRLASVRHPNVVAIHAAEEVAGRAAIVMELVRGRTLEQILCAQGRFGAGELAAIGLDLCRALAAVHHAGLVHGDVKTQNVVREDGGRIVLMDFGPRGATPMFMAPELFAGGKPALASDLYSLGVLLFRLATGSYPVSGESLDDLRAAHARGDRIRVRDARPDLPEALVKSIDRALEPSPAARFATAGEMENALGGETDKPTSSRARIARANIVIGVLIGALLLASAMILRERARSPVAGAPGKVTRHERTTVEQTAAQTNAAQSDRLVESPAAFTIEASLFRGDSQQQSLSQGARLALGDSLSLVVRASTQLFLYVLDEDDLGEAYLLFPSAQFIPTNPLAANVQHVLPGKRDGRPYYWQVTSRGGREHILIVASPRPLPGLERETLALDRPREAAVAPIGEAALDELRGLGAYAAGAVPEEPALGADASAGRGAARDSARRLFELAEPLRVGPESASGVWIRRIDLENPER